MIALVINYIRTWSRTFGEKTKIPMVDIKQKKTLEVARGLSPAT